MSHANVLNYTWVFLYFQTSSNGENDNSDSLKGGKYGHGSEDAHRHGAATELNTALEFKFGLTGWRYDAVAKLLHVS